jgi:nicotinamide-nucleotide adenylyltransferase
VKKIRMYKRGKYEATEIRRRILAGEDWKELVPTQVYRIIKEVDGENRIIDIMKSDSVNNPKRAQ